VCGKHNSVEIKPSERAERLRAFIEDCLHKCMPACCCMLREPSKKGHGGGCSQSGPSHESEPVSET